jgi:hypothetical protein
MSFFLCFNYSKVDETLKRHIRKNKHKKVSKNFLKQRVDLDEVALNLAAEKRARVKDVVSFLRRNKRIERTTQAVEEGWFQEEQDYEDLIVPAVEETQESAVPDVKEEEKVTLDTFWDSVVVGDAQDKAKERKLERLKYRDNYTKNMTMQEVEKHVFFVFSSFQVFVFFRLHKSVVHKTFEENKICCMEQIKYLSYYLW